MQQTHHQSSSEQATTTYLRMPPHSRPLSRRGSTGLAWPPRHTTAGSRGASLAPWSDSIPSLSRVQENPEPRWGEEGRVPRVWGGGAPHPAPRSPPSSNRTRAPRRKSWPLILALTRRPRAPLCLLSPGRSGPGPEDFVLPPLPSPRVLGIPILTQIVAKRARPSKIFANIFPSLYCIRAVASPVTSPGELYLLNFIFELCFVNFIL
jgi:hypothetical protein